MIDLAAKFGLIQKVDKATNTFKILDLILSSDMRLITDINVESFPIFSDHKYIMATFNLWYRIREELDPMPLTQMVGC